MCSNRACDNVCNKVTTLFTETQLRVPDFNRRREELASRSRRQAERRLFFPFKFKTIGTFLRVGHDGEAHGFFSTWPRSRSG